MNFGRCAQPHAPAALTAPAPVTAGVPPRPRALCRCQPDLFLPRLRTHQPYLKAAFLRDFLQEPQPGSRTSPLLKRQRLMLRPERGDPRLRTGWDGMGWVHPDCSYLRGGKGCSHSKKPSPAQQPYQPCFKTDIDCSSSCCLELEARNQTQPAPRQHGLEGPLKFHHQIPMACNFHPTPHESHNQALTSSVRSLRSHLCKPRQPPAPQPI